MRNRTLGLAVIIASAIAATSAVLAYDIQPPAGPRTNEGVAKPQDALRDGGKMTAPQQRSDTTDTCRLAQWPYVPAECSRNASPEQRARVVRIVPVHVLPSR